MGYGIANGTFVVGPRFNSVKRSSELLSRFQGVSLLGMVWNDVSQWPHYTVDMDSPNAELGAIEEIEQMMKDGKKNGESWAVENVPEMWILDVDGNRVERAKKDEHQENVSIT
jgi:hypothetical protein